MGFLSPSCAVCIFDSAGALVWCAICQGVSSQGRWIEASGQMQWMHILSHVWVRVLLQIHPGMHKYSLSLVGWNCCIASGNWRLWKRGGCLSTVVHCPLKQPRHCTAGLQNAAVTTLSKRRRTEACWCGCCALYRAAGCANAFAILYVGMQLFV
jgi:hypothetical protein